MSQAYYQYTVNFYQKMNQKAASLETLTVVAKTPTPITTHRNLVKLQDYLRLCVKERIDVLWVKSDSLTPVDAEHAAKVSPIPLESLFCVDYDEMEQTLQDQRVSRH